MVIMEYSVMAKGPMPPSWITHATLTNAAGTGLSANRRALQEARSGLKPCDFETIALKTWVGQVQGLEESPLPDRFALFDSRIHRLIRRGVEQDQFVEAVQKAQARYGTHRVGLIFATSTSGILETEVAYRQRDAEGRLPKGFRYQAVQNTFSGALFLSQYLKLQGPLLTLSTACSSSAKAFASASRWLAADLCDAVIIGAADSLCGTTIYGFHSLGLVAETPCQPFGENRTGISIGEAAGFALLERNPNQDTDLAVLGYGESSDAFHMSTPHPEGLGAKRAMLEAIDRAGLNPDQIDYVLLHGTGTQANDLSEDLAVSTVFGTQTPCSSIKGLIGHTLGVAGITNVLIGMLCLQAGWMPKTFMTQKLDHRLKSHVLTQSSSKKLDHIVCNAFGFGGSNCSLVIGRRHV